MNLVSAFLLLATAAAPAPPPAAPSTAMDPASCPLHAQHMAAAGKDAAAHATMDAAHAADVDRRGDVVMGFAAARTSHHFRLTHDGGAIEADALDPADAASRDSIRSHFAEIALQFARGDFSAPLAIHGTQAPGVETLRLLADRVRYTVEETPAGGRVRIATADPLALAAVHDFLRFQIAEHRTGDEAAVAP